jgi:hypothetical protein
VLGTTQVIPVPTADERQGIDMRTFPGDTLTVPVNPAVEPESVLAEGDLLKARIERCTTINNNRQDFWVCDFWRHGLSRSG